MRCNPRPTPILGWTKWREFPPECGFPRPPLLPGLSGALVVAAGHSAIAFNLNATHRPKDVSVLIGVEEVEEVAVPHARRGLCSNGGSGSGRVGVSPEVGRPSDLLTNSQWAMVRKPLGYTRLRSASWGAGPEPGPQVPFPDVNLRFFFRVEAYRGS